MAALVTLSEAKAHLRIADDDQDTTLEERAADATAIVMDYLKRSPTEWTAGTVPGPVRAAIFLVLGTLWRFRTGAGEGAADQDPLSPAVRSLLARHRDPALA